MTRLTLVSDWSGVGSATADPGRVTSAPDVVAEPTQVALLNLPDLGFGRPGVPAIHVAACQASAPYRPVQLEVSIGSERRTIRSALQEAVLGRTLTGLPDGQSTVFDLCNSVEVELHDGEHWLESCDDEALINGANLAALGEELIQYGAAEQIGERRFRLSRLLRGRRGTEWAMPFHQSGERFCVLVPAALVAVEAPLGAAGSTVEVQPNGVADDNLAGVSGTMSAEALRPPSPVRLAIARDGGGIVFSWTRRSRLGWAWVDGIDAPLGETAERYRVDVQGTAGSISIDTTETRLALTDEAVAAIGAGEAAVSIRQVGDFAMSHPLSGTLTI